MALVPYVSRPIQLARYGFVLSLVQGHLEPYLLAGALLEGHHVFSEYALGYRECSFRRSSNIVSTLTFQHVRFYPVSSRLSWSGRGALYITLIWPLTPTLHAPPDHLPRAVTLILCEMLGTIPAHMHVATLSLGPHMASPYTISDAAGSPQSTGWSDGGGIWDGGAQYHTLAGCLVQDPWNGMERSPCHPSPQPCPCSDLAASGTRSRRPPTRR